MDSREMYDQFKSWILEQKDSAYRIEVVNEDAIDCVTDDATAHVQFFHLEYEIVSFTIDSPKSEEPLFFLHFELQDMDHAKELFVQMIQSLKKAGENVKVKVLLSCTSGFTTSYFADRLNTAADTLSLDYSFSAVSYTDLFEAAQDQDVILLAPQIGYLLKKARKVLKDQIVLQIPADVFASYNVTKVFDLIREQLAEKEKKEEVVEDIHDPEWDSCIGIAAIVRRGGRYEIHFRGADKEAPLDRSLVVKETLDLHDIEDVLDVMMIRYPQIKALAIVAPGVVEDGRLTLPAAKINNLDLAEELTKRYKRRVVILNDANAAALGYYANNRECGNLLTYYHPVGNAVGDAGIVIDGNLVIGRKDIAGECAAYLKLLNFSEDRFDLARTPEGISELVAKIVLPMICTFGPDTLALYCDLLTDPQELKNYLNRYLDEKFIPEIVKMKSNLWEVFYGAGVMLYNVLHESVEYRKDLKQYIES